VVNTQRHCSWYTCVVTNKLKKSSPVLATDRKTATFISTNPVARGERKKERKKEKKTTQLQAMFILGGQTYLMP
jgi:hypothetical protein